MSIVFGSPEAQAIRERDRKLAIEENPARRAELQEELRGILWEIESLQEQLAELEDAAAEVRGLLGVAL